MLLSREFSSQAIDSALTTPNFQVPSLSPL